MLPFSVNDKADTFFAKATVPSELTVLYYSFGRESCRWRESRIKAFFKQPFQQLGQNLRENSWWTFAEVLIWPEWSIDR